MLRLLQSQDSFRGRQKKLVSVSMCEIANMAVRLANILLKRQGQLSEGF
jgi:hypothetical protein